MKSQRPNVLFILTDQQRYDALSCHGPIPIETPNFDRLASQGTRFDHAVTPCPLCVPARLSVLNGQTVSQHGVFINEHSVDKRTKTWGNILQEDGYTTLAFGKSHGINKGFQVVPAPYGRSYDHQAGQIPGKQEQLFDWTPARWPHGRTVVESKQPLETFFDVLVAEQVKSSLATLVNSSEPWALHVGLFYPHPPYILPKEFASLVDPNSIEVPAFDRDELETKTKGQRNMHDKYFDLPEEHQRRMIAGYWGCVALADYCLGLILDELTRLGMDENTFVCATSDHGDMNGEHGLYTKFSSAYEGEVRVPLIMRWPKHIPKGKVDNALVSLIDIMPTLLDATKSSCPETCSGISLLPRLQGKEDGEHRAFVTAVTGWVEFPDFRPFGHMIRTRTHKLVYYPNDTCELYDLVNDPGEKINQWENPIFREYRNSLQIMLLHDLINQTAIGHRLPLNHNEVK